MQRPPDASQQIASMNSRPPRAVKPSRLAAFPAANALILNRLIGTSARQSSSRRHRTRPASPTPRALPAMIQGLFHRSGRRRGPDPVGDDDQQRAQAYRRPDVSAPVGLGAPGGRDLPALIRPDLPNSPIGTFAQNPRREPTAASRPPAAARRTARNAGDLVGAQRHAALVRGERVGQIAAEFDISIAPPKACTNRKPISHIAPWVPVSGSRDSAIEASVKTTKPRL